jgi:N,N'-diacetyllegionaminate synthase
MEAMKKVYIIGAGPSGLIVGWELAKKGISIVIFEKSNITGGMCRSWKEGNYILDTGPHIYHTPDVSLSESWRESFGDLLVEGEFWSKNTIDGDVNRLVDYPLSWESIHNFDDGLRSKILNELSFCDQNRSIGAKTFSEYVENLVGPTLADMFFTKYPEKVWGISTKELTADWAPKRIEIRQSITPFYSGQFAAVGKYGTGCIYDRIRDEILKLGGEIRLDEGVTSMEFSNNSCVELRTSDNKMYSISEEDTVVSTMPITLLGRMMGLRTSLKFRGICTVYIGVLNDKLMWPEGVHWLYFDKTDLHFNRITNSTKLSSSVSPDNYSLISVESTYTKGDQFDSQPKEEIIKIIVEQVASTGLFNAGDVDFTSINKEDFVYPLQFPGYQGELVKLTSKIDSIHNLYSLGTGGDFNYADSQVIFYKAKDLVDIISNKLSIYTQTLKKKQRLPFLTSFYINNVKIGMDCEPVVIGEIGLNHNGNIDLAYKLIDESFNCGLKFVKLQAYKSGNSRVSSKVRSANYVEKITDQEETLSQMFDKYNLSLEDQKKLFAYARSKGLIVFSTPFDTDSADFLNNELNPDCYKIASVDLVNLPLISHVASFGKPIILSCGMSSLSEIEDALDCISISGNDKVILLHCISSYPAAVEEMNLNVIKTLQSTFKVPAGLSDHSLGILASTLSLASGACVIERHFTLDCLMEGPDHILSSEPEEMQELVYIAKNVKKILGDGIKRIENGEYANINSQRKCLYSRRNLKSGEILKLEDIVIKGPAGGILPKFLDLVVGKKLQEPIESDYPITWEKLLK